MTEARSLVCLTLGMALTRSLVSSYLRKTWREISRSSSSLCFVTKRIKGGLYWASMEEFYESYAAVRSTGQWTVKNDVTRLKLITGEWYSLIWATLVCAAPKGRIFIRFGQKHHFGLNRMWFLHFSLELRLFYLFLNKLLFLYRFDRRQKPFTMPLQLVWTRIRELIYQKTGLKQSIGSRVGS